MFFNKQIQQIINNIYIVFSLNNLRQSGFISIIYSLRLYIQIIKMNKQSLVSIILIILALFNLALGLQDPNFPFSHTDPNFHCSSFCKYLTDGSGNLVPMCNNNLAGVNGNGQCTDCDELLFRKIPPTGGTYNCTAHNYNGEYLEVSQDLTASGYYLGYYTDTSATWINLKTWSASLNGGITLPPHFAVRIRFGIYLYNYLQTIYNYPLSYSLDETVYTYDQTLYDYWSSYDIITSPTQLHSAPNLTVTFRSLNNSYPVNTDTCPYNTCQCRCSYQNTLCTWITVCGGYNDCFLGCGACSCPQTLTCCDQRYIQIRDIILFSSHCGTGCLSCSSQTYCKICDYSNLYYLNPDDHLCYKVCPQATYPNDTGVYFVTDPNTLIFENWCLTCNATCLECSSPSVCSRCYTLGRNESFLFNNTCVNPCPTNYARNYTNHTCDCSINNFYEIPATPECLPCALECLHCTGPTNLQCSLCMPGFFRANGTTNCLNDCPAGQFKELATGTCSNCDSSCGSCDSMSTKCTECFFVNGGGTTMYLLGTECLSWCPPGYAWNNVTHTCDVCALYTFSYVGKCVKYCPTLYQSDEANRSCTHLSQSDFTFNLTIASIDIVPHGKLIKFTILVEDGLNNNSLIFILKQSYFLVQILCFNSNNIAFTGIRTLQQINLAIRNVQYSNNYISYYTNIPDLDYQKSFQIVFMRTITSSQGIDYANITAVMPVSQNPKLIKQYFTYCIRNYYSVIAIPLIMLILLLILLQLKGVYQLLMQFLRVVQILGLLAYSSFPVKEYIFSFLIGCSYSNLDFIPNLYALFAQPEPKNVFASYFLMSDDMDFIRLNGSIISFIVIWAIIYLVCKYFFSFRDSRLDFMIRFGCDLLQVKILHSFWSSFLFVIINYKATDFAIYLTFGCALLFFIAVIARRVKIWKETNEISPFFLWRLLSTLLICFVSLGNQIISTLIFLVSIVIVLWQFYLLHSHKLLTSILYLDSSNYMDEHTFKVITTYEKDVKYSFAVTIRNIIFTIFPLITAILAAITILLKQVQITVVIIDASIFYTLFLFIIVITILVYHFLQQRRKYLVQSKLQYLQRKFAKIQSKKIQSHSERKRPRLDNSKINDTEIFFSTINRSMIKSFD